MSAVIQAKFKRTEYKTPQTWRSDAIKVVVIGAGGNGSEVVDTLATFHHALISLGHPAGLHVTVIDDAVVREPNLVRQRFWPCDLGQYKAIALVNRYNMMLGLQWEARPEQFSAAKEQSAVRRADIVISAVDTASARREIAHAFNHHNGMWLDLGNAHRHGQVIFGALDPAMRTKYPTAVDIYPEILTMKDSLEKSCSAAESLATQDCLINRAVTTAGMSIIWEVLRYGKTDKNVVSVNLETGENMVGKFPDH
ncbi:PRTRC system ThiF family protein (plasmid) [Halopseudomonas sp. SMJS2]|uniref:PRTRC system ThiF family protein n=1 Tax=Halopseudomonas sp. SMJS2 TaxID=3041098 RepID=UPI0024536AE4|nr:PRTRC system ThiF family protein [Halopseudomonas sp. SMJS2]WGK63399.1 PRTRC system ThiF family protein [Halopseudomonas sp. SMJS2]